MSCYVSTNDRRGKFHESNIMAADCIIKKQEQYTARRETDMTRHIVIFWYIIYLSKYYVIKMKGKAIQVCV